MPYILPYTIYFYKYWQTLFRSFNFFPEFLTTNRALSHFFIHIMHSEWSNIVFFLFRFQLLKTLIYVIINNITETKPNKHKK